MCVALYHDVYMEVRGVWWSVLSFPLYVGSGHQTKVTRLSWQVPLPADASFSPSVNFLNIDFTLFVYASVFMYSCVCRCKCTYLGSSVRICAHICGGQKSALAIHSSEPIHLFETRSLTDTCGTMIGPNPAKEALLATHYPSSSIASTSEG